MSTKLFSGIGSAAILASTVALAGTAQAATLTHTDTFERSPLGITDEILSVQKFDSSLGTLTKVTLGFNAEAVGSAWLESRDAAARTLTYNADVRLSLGEASGTLSELAGTASLSGSFDATAFDGGLDFGGTSGMKDESLASDLFREATFDDETLLSSFFTGDGNLDFLFSASSSSSVKGSANIMTAIRTQAAAGVTITYHYDEEQGGVAAAAVPEPSLLLGIGSVLGGGFLVRRKRNQAVS